MTTARPISELYAEFTPEEIREIAAGQQLLITEHEALSKLKKARNLTQKEVAELLDIRQAAVSKIKHTD